MVVRRTKSVAQLVLGDRFCSYDHWGPHPAVGLSCFCFALPAALQVAHGLCLATAPEEDHMQRMLHLASYATLSVFFTLVTVTCALADYFYIRQGCRSFYGRVDIWVALTTMILASVDFCCRHTWQQTAVLDSLTLVAFLFTGLSPSFPQWVVRHCIWHAVAGGLLVYGTMSAPWEAPAQAGRLQPFIIGACAVYSFAAATGIGVCVCSSERVRQSAWNYGAKFADWREAKSGSLAEPLMYQAV